MKRIREKKHGRRRIQTLAVTVVVLVFSAMALPAAAQQSEPLNLSDVAVRMNPETLEKVSRMIVEPVQKRFSDRAATEDMLGEPKERRATEHQSIHDPDYTFEEVVLDFPACRVSFFVFPDREVFSAFEGDPAEAGVEELEVGQAAGEIENLLGKSVKRPQDMLYSDGEWWLVRFVLDSNDHLREMELYIFFD
ncbi:MAG: hypothetical protein ACLFN0_08460 [Thermovirgaceae bacterium]